MRVSDLSLIRMRIILTAVLTLALIAPAGCQRERAKVERSRLSKCMEDLDEIPALAALLKVHKQDEDFGQSRSLEGMEIALTINGMILSSGEPEKGIDSWCEWENNRENFDKIVAALRQNSMPPALAFVSGMYADKTLLAQWVESGNLVGNLTFSRRKVKEKAIGAFFDDIARNEEMLAPLWKGRATKYFRYPRMKSNQSRQTREQVEAWLQSNGYQNVLATIVAPTDKFSEPYCSALARSDHACAGLIRDYFKKLLLDASLRARSIARKRAGREIRHILMLKANQFFCDSLADLLAWYRGLGARFIPIEEAMRDPVYSLIDDKGRPVPIAILHETERKQRARLGKGQEE